MLVNCPRCGFTQPKDKYCAQCGVDTETFKPPQPSSMASLRRTLSNPLLFLGIAAIALVFLFKSFQRPTTESLSERVQFLKGHSQIASRTDHADASQADAASRGIASTTTTSKNETSFVDDTTNSNASADAALKGNANGEAALMGATSNAPATAPTPANAGLGVNPKAAADGETNVTIYYAEVPTRSLERLYQESQATGFFNTFGDYTAGTLPDVEKRILSDAMKIHVFQKTEDTIGNVQKHWFTGIQDHELRENLGFTTFIELADTENNSFRGNLEVVRAWRANPEGGTGASVQKTSFPASFELSPGAGFFFAGIMPPKSFLSDESELTRQAPFQILNSVPFKSNASEFVIFIEFRKKP